MSSAFRLCSSAFFCCTSLCFRSFSRRRAHSSRSSRLFLMAVTATLTPTMKFPRQFSTS